DDPGSDKNYQKLVISTVADDLYAQESIKTITSRWFGQAGDDAAALSLANHLKNRYTETPIIFSGMLDVKDKSSMILGGTIDVTSASVQDATGAAKTTQMQVTYLEEKDERLLFKAESSYFTGRYGLVTNTARPNYAGSSANQRNKGTYIVSATSLKFADGTSPYLLY
ncbi:MAG: hypothetical protein EBT13_13785, partial [Rhodobacteraceae bacterium]|nr:hypothetical protein [Paracoccaceae bacterium]